MIDRFTEREGHVQRRIAQFTHSGVLLEGGGVATALDLGDRETPPPITTTAKASRMRMRMCAAIAENLTVAIGRGGAQLEPSGAGWPSPAGRRLPISAESRATHDDPHREDRARNALPLDYAAATTCAS
jgi:hypothetical protein